MTFPTRSPRNPKGRVLFGSRPPIALMGAALLLALAGCSSSGSSVAGAGGTTATHQQTGGAASIEPGSSERLPTPPENAPLVGGDPLPLNTNGSEGLALGATAGTTAAAGTGATGNPAATGLEAARSRCLELVNADRASIGIAAVTLAASKSACTDAEAASDSQSKQPHGAFGQCGEGAQNECPDWPGAPDEMVERCIAAFWAEGPGEPYSAHGHYLNMANAKYTRISCGFYSHDGSTFLTMNFY